MAQYTINQATTQAQWCQTVSVSATQNVAVGDTIEWSPSVAHAGSFSTSMSLTYATKVITTTNCTYTGNTSLSTSKTISFANAGAWSITMTVTHYTSTSQGCVTNGNRVKTFTISGTVSVATGPTTFELDLEHMGINNGWELGGINVGYQSQNINLNKGDTLVLNFLGSATSYADRWRVSGINHNYFSNLTGPTINSPSNVTTGTATLTVNTGALPENNTLDIVSINYREDGDSLNDGDDGLVLRLRMFEGDENFPDTDVDVTFSATPSITVLPNPDLLDDDTTAFSVNIANGSSNTIYEVREDSYLGTVLASRTGSGTINLINHLPAYGGVKYYYITGRRTAANSGSNVPYQITNKAFQRDFAPNAFGFEVRNEDDEVIIDQSQRLPKLLASGTYTTPANTRSGSFNILVPGFEYSDDYHVLFSPLDFDWEGYKDY